MYTSCDFCSGRLIPIIWGYPAAFPESVWELINNGQLIPGGCAIDSDIKSCCEHCRRYSSKQAEIPDNLF